MRPGTILVIRQHNQMGDMVCATPAFRALRQAYPESRLVLICAPLNWDVVRHNPDLDQVLVIDKRWIRRPQQLWRFWRELRRLRPELAFVLNSVSISVTSALLAWLAGAPVIVGGDSRPYGFDFSRYLYSFELPSTPELDQHAVLHGLAPLATLGITTDDLQTVVVPGEREIEAAERLLPQAEPAPPIWLLHPGAGKRQNIWPAERFAAIAIRAARNGVRLLVLQGPIDGEVMTKFRQVLASASPSVRERISVLPVQSVGVCAALLDRAERFLCNDTGLMHVAGAVGTPTVALFGPTDPALWKPLAQNVVAVVAEAGVMTRLEVSTVWEALRQL